MKEILKFIWSVFLLVLFLAGFLFRMILYARYAVWM